MHLHNLKIAWRNLMKYKLQTVISVLSISVGIVTLSVTYSIMGDIRMPEICDQPYYDRVYSLTFDSISDGGDGIRRMRAVDRSVFRALTRDGGMACVEGEAVMSNSAMMGSMVKVFRGDSVWRQSLQLHKAVDPNYPHFFGMRSAVTGEIIRPLRKGEAIISQSSARYLVGEENPVGMTVSVQLPETSAMFTIIDVYERPSNVMHDFQSSLLVYAMDDNTDSQDASPLDQLFSCADVYVVLKEGFTAEQLAREANERLRPLGLRAEWHHEKDVSDDYSEMLAVAKPTVLLIGSLILLAAVIGFLRMQTQLFWMRRREISLRIVNGARRTQLFLTLMTEAGMVICAAALAAVLEGTWLEDYLTDVLPGIMSQASEMFTIDCLAEYALAVGGALLAACALIVWITLSRICKAGQGLAAHMRHSRSHTWRNIMLGVQITIGMTFVCFTFQIIQLYRPMLAEFHVPEAPNRFEECVLVNGHGCENWTELAAELGALPDAEVRVPMCYDADYVKIWEEVTEEPTSRRSRFLADTTLLAFCDMGVRWTAREKSGRCVLIEKDFYRQLEEAGAVGNGVITLKETFLMQTPVDAYPIAGTFTSFPYDERLPRLLFIEPNLPDYRSFLLFAKRGRYPQLMEAAREAVRRHEPALAETVVGNAHEAYGQSFILYTALHNAAWILAVVSLLICSMGIYSAIALDTRGRRKEVAIRKINGAKRRDIILLFGRLYIALAVCASLIAVPVNALLKDLSPEEYRGEAVAVGALTVIALIAAIVGWQVSKVMRVNPAEFLAKE